MSVCSFCVKPSFFAFRSRQDFRTVSTGQHPSFQDFGSSGCRVERVRYRHHRPCTRAALPYNTLRCPSERTLRTQQAFRWLQLEPPSAASTASFTSDASKNSADSRGPILAVQANRARTQVGLCNLRLPRRRSPRRPSPFPFGTPGPLPSESVIPTPPPHRTAHRQCELQTRCATRTSRPILCSFTFVIAASPASPARRHRGTPRTH